MMKGSDLSDSLISVSSESSEDSIYNEINGICSPTVDNEFLLQESSNRFTIYPIKHKDIWDMYKKQFACFWSVEEVDLSKDYSDFTKMNDNERHFIKNILAFFAASDGIVNMNLLERFSTEVKVTEAQVAYTFQAMMENVHGEMYSLLLDTYIKNTSEKENLLNAIHTIPCITKKAKWALDWIESDDSFAKRLIAFAIVEGIFFSGSFCAIFWLKQRNLMPGLTMSNEFISRDEGMHCDFACLLYSKIKNRIDGDTVEQIFREAVDIEKEFITESLPCNLIGMNSMLMSEYIEFVADRLIVQLGYEKIYKTKNPFGWMDSISVESKSNFFETRVSQYQKASVLNETSAGDFTIVEDF